MNALRRRLPLRLVTLDVTGTLLEFREPVPQQYVTAAAELGVVTDTASVQAGLQRTWPLLAKAHPNFGQATGLGWRGWWRSMVLGAFAHTTAEPATLEALAEHLIEHFQTQRAWCVAQGGLQLVQDLREQGLALGIISNFDPRLHTLIANMGLSASFSFVLTSYEVGWAKPNRRIFAEALKRAGLADAGQAVHVGNDRRLDLDGALAASWNAILVGKGDADEAVAFPRRATNLTDVARCVQTINANRG